MPEHADILPRHAPEALRRMLQIWCDIAQERRPVRADFPVDETTLRGLAILVPCDQGGGARDYCFEYAGPEHTERTGRALTGASCSEVVHPWKLKHVIETYDEIFSSGEPHYWDFVNTINGAPPQAYSRLLLPLFDGAGNVEAAIGLWVWR